MTGKIAPRTRKALEEAIHTAFHDLAHPLTGEAREKLLDAIEEGFTVKRKPSAIARPEQPVPAAGQVWRNRSSGRLVEVEARGGGDIYWKCIDNSRGPKNGCAWWPTFYDKYDYIEGAENG